MYIHGNLLHAAVRETILIVGYSFSNYIHTMFKQFFFYFLQVSNSLKWPWYPKEDHELPMAVFDAQADAELAYIDILLSDQMPK